MAPVCRERAGWRRAYRLTCREPFVACFTSMCSAAMHCRQATAGIDPSHGAPSRREMELMVP